ncbi:MAG: hypothetical protein AB1656_23510 [Candidatus Omnitrophota bacterium]
MPEKERPTLTEYDALEIWRCPQLGGPVTFEYCRRMNARLPCHQLMRCWEKRMDIQTYLNENFSRKEIGHAFSSPPPSRMGTIFDVLKQVAEGRTGEGK